MMGNWSLGDYFKKEAITWSFELLTSKEEGFGLDPSRLYVTVFEGNEDAPRDTESFEIWKSIGVPENRIYFLPAKSNWWSAGENGPCGPDTEMFYDITQQGLGDLSHEEFLRADQNQEVVEIWNDVFMEYMKTDGKVVGKLPLQNVDTGSGLERIAMVLQKKENVFDTDLFAPIMDAIRLHTGGKALRAERIIADHMRTSALLIVDGVRPSNADQGYILRRLIRRSVRFSDAVGIPHNSLGAIAELAGALYTDVYPEVSKNLSEIKQVIDAEELKFRNTLKEGMKRFDAVSKSNRISGEDAFMLFTTYGFPIEMTEEIAKERGIQVDRDVFNTKFIEHQNTSRAGASLKFKGGLADTSNESIRYHTATHLLHQALRDVLGNSVMQKGSNITSERLRFDFAFDRKLTDDEKKQVEDIVNKHIKASLPVQKVTLPKEEAEKSGALHFFGEKYGDTVTVYFIGENIDQAYSKEFCGGPHVSNTIELGHFTIQKEEAVSAGVRRIKAVLT